MRLIDLKLNPSCTRYKTWSSFYIGESTFRTHKASEIALRNGLMKDWMMPLGGEIRVYYRPRKNEIIRVHTQDHLITNVQTPYDSLDQVVNTESSMDGYVGLPWTFRAIDYLEGQRESVMKCLVETVKEMVQYTSLIDSNIDYDFQPRTTVRKHHIVYNPIIEIAGLGTTKSQLRVYLNGLSKNMKRGFRIRTGQKRLYKETVNQEKLDLDKKPPIVFEVTIPEDTNIDMKLKNPRFRNLRGILYNALRESLKDINLTTKKWLHTETFIND